MDDIYELANTAFKAKGDVGQRLQYKILKDEIAKLLASKRDDIINNAINQAQEDERFAVTRLIEDIIQELIDIHYLSDGVHNLRSDLFLVPIITRNGDGQTNFPAIGQVEKTLNEKFIEFKLMPITAQIVIAPIILGHQTSKDMTPSKWYLLHKQILATRDKRDIRPSFSNPFAIKTTANYATLNFLVATIIQNKYSAELLRPNLFSNDYYISQDRKKVTLELQKIALTRPEAEIIFLEPKSTLNSLIQGYNAQQELVIEAFIQRYKDNDKIDFAVLSIDVPNSFVIFAWNNAINKIINCLLVEPFAVEMQENVDKVMEYMSETDRLVYVGNTVISSSIIDNYTDFDFQEYLNSDGATILKSQEVLDD